MYILCKYIYIRVLPFKKKLKKCINLSILPMNSWFNSKKNQLTWQLQPNNFTAVPGSIGRSFGLPVPLEIFPGGSLWLEIPMQWRRLWKYHISQHWVLNSTTIPHFLTQMFRIRDCFTNFMVYNVIFIVFGDDKTLGCYQHEGLYNTWFDCKTKSSCDLQCFCLGGSSFSEISSINDRNYLH